MISNYDEKRAELKRIKSRKFQKGGPQKTIQALLATHKEKSVSFMAPVFLPLS